MPAWLKKADAQLARMMEPGEQELHSGYGAVGLKGAKFTLTNKRFYLFHVGATALSEPKMAVIELPYIITVEFDRGLMGTRTNTNNKQPHGYLPHPACQRG